MADRVCAVIPCFEGSQTIASVVEKTRAVLEHVLVIDDGSKDATADQARTAGAEVLRHPENRGKGAALLSALERAKQLGFSHAVSLDGDGQHDPADIPALLETAKRTPRALVVGTRDFSVAHVPGASKFGRKFSNFWVWLETGSRLSDTQSGFRVYPVAHALALGVGPSRFQWEVEVIVKARWAGLPVIEVPVRVYYPPPAERVSHYRGFVDSWRISLMHCRLVPRAILRPLWPTPRLLLP